MLQVKAIAYKLKHKFTPHTTHQTRVRIHVRKLGIYLYLKTHVVERYWRSSHVKCNWHNALTIVIFEASTLELWLKATKTMKETCLEQCSNLRLIRIISLLTSSPNEYSSSSIYCVISATTTLVLSKHEHEYSATSCVNIDLWDWYILKRNLGQGLVVYDAPINSYFSLTIWRDLGPYSIY